MPILESAQIERPLQQGDVLQGVRLHSTLIDGVSDGGDAHATTDALSLVISRPCVIEHKDSIVVSLVKSVTDEIPGDVKSLADCRDFLCRLRDGVRSPDIFYLGELPASSSMRRFVARLDSLHTIRATSQDELIRYRIAGMNVDFVRSLHTRLFQSYASLGFDDLRWYGNADLEVLIKFGKRDESEMKAEIHRIETEIAKCNFGGESESKKLNGLNGELEKRKQALQDVSETLGQYAQELQSRSGGIRETRPTTDAPS